MKMNVTLWPLLMLGLILYVAEPPEVPSWMSVDHEAKTVTMDIVAGKTDAYNHWNFNGYAKGEATVVVPVGYTVTINFKNDDPVMVHSLGIGPLEDTFPAMFTDVKPAFEGAMSSNPTDMTNATKPGASETLTFTADKAGDYAMICLIPGHAMAGMWIKFSVSADGQAGLIAP